MASISKRGATFFGALLTSVAASTFSLPIASAHDVVMKASPGDKSTVSQFPREIELEFSGIPKDTFNTIAVSNQDTGEILFTENPTLEKQFVRVQVPDNVQPGAGNYKVGFQITSSDGHATRGMTTFTVAKEAAGDSKSTGAASATATSTVGNSDDFVASSSESPYPNKAYLALAIGIAILVIAVVVGVGLTISKRKK